MEIKVTNWKISTLLKKREKINEQPEYQRGKVWSAEKEALLIDSIIRGIDIPKIYLRKIANHMHEFEVADGQQRLTAIFNFFDGKVKLLDKNIKGLLTGKVDNIAVGGKKFEDIDPILRTKFLNTEITVSVINECTEDEVRILFGRLQEGVTLNAAEKRNAIISVLGKHIDSFVRNHKFFGSCKISEQRFKHQDYLAHVFALVYYNNYDDLKGNLLEKLYLDKKINVSANDLQRIDFVLDVLHDIDQAVGKRIINKFTFIDIFWFLYRNLTTKGIKVTQFKTEFNKFETDRLNKKDDLKKLAQEKNPYSINLYNYIMNYDRTGSLSDSIEVRARVFDSLFKKFLN